MTAGLLILDRMPELGDPLDLDEVHSLPLHELGEALQREGHHREAGQLLMCPKGQIPIAVLAANTVRIFFVGLMAAGGMA